MEYVATAVKPNFQLHVLDMSVVLAAFDLQLTEQKTMRLAKMLQLNC